MQDKRIPIHASFRKDNVEWLDKMVKLNKYRSRSHGIEDCVQKERERWEEEEQRRVKPLLR